MCGVVVFVYVGLREYCVCGVCVWCVCVGCVCGVCGVGLCCVCVSVCMCVWV